LQKTPGAKGKGKGKNETVSFLPPTTEDDDDFYIPLPPEFTYCKDCHKDIEPQDKGNGIWECPDCGFGVALLKYKGDPERKPVSFAEDTAAKTGKSKRTVEQLVQISKNITPNVKEIIRDTPVANSKRDLLALSRIKDPEKQEQTARRLIEKPHVSHNSGNNEWYTPPKIIEAARSVMGGIDCDPASSSQANKIVKAKTFFSESDDGLKQKWTGRVWMNPPYAQPAISNFSAALYERVKSGEVLEACVLVNNATETAWCQTMMSLASCICFPRARIKFLDMEGNALGAPLQGQMVIYIGENIDEFKEQFSGMGLIFFYME